MKLSPEGLADLLKLAGLEIAPDPDPGTDLIRHDYVFTRCKRCGAEAHYRPKYIVEKTMTDEVCRACFWNRWFRNTGVPVPMTLSDFSRKDFERSLADKGYHLIGAMGESTVQLLVIRCVNCGKQSVVRTGDVWRCECGGRNASRGVPYAQTHHQVPRPDFPRSVTLIHPSDGSTSPTYLYQDGSPAPLSLSTSGCLKWWDQKRNLPLTTDTVTRKSQQWVWWICPHCGLHFQAPISYMERMPSCPICSEVDEFHFELSYHDESCRTVGDFPSLRKQWDDDADPATVPLTDYHLRRFHCPHGHHPRQTPSSYFNDGCMVCRGLATKASHLQPSLRQSDPELAAEWVRSVTDRPGEHHTPNNVGIGSKRRVLWECLACGHQWIDTVRNRERRCSNRCPECGKVMGSFAWKYPSLAEQWDPANPTSPWNTKPYGRLTFTPQWICPRNPHHKWRASIASRIRKGSDCPYCEQSDPHK